MSNLASHENLLTKKQIERLGFLFGELPHARTFRGVNDLIRDARARLRYEADLSFSREAFKQEVTAPGNTLRLPIASEPLTEQISLLMSLAK